MTRRRLRRALRALAIVGLSVTAIVLLALAFAHTPRGRSELRDALERWASSATGGTVRLADLDLGAWRAEASATGGKRIASLSFRRASGGVDGAPAEAAD
jgi:hypothetical protein